MVHRRSFVQSNQLSACVLLSGFLAVSTDPPASLGIIGAPLRAAKLTATMAGDSNLWNWGFSLY